MSVTIYHNPRCSKSRQALEILRSEGVDPKIVEYLKTPLGYQDIETLMGMLGLYDPRLMMRKGEADYKVQNLKDDSVSKEVLIQAMVDFPKLIERAIVVTEKGARICRPPELVREIL